MGLSLDDDLYVCVCIHGNNDAGVRLSVEELALLLDEQWQQVVMQHFETPRFPGVTRLMATCEFKCVVAKEVQPMLRISNLDQSQPSYVLLGENTCKMLFEFAHLISYKIEKLQSLSVKSEDWFVNLVGKLRQFLRVTDVSLQNEKEVQVALRDYVKKNMCLTDEKTDPDQKEFEFEMLVRFKDILGKIVMDTD